jgi:hypothetical protein
MKWCVSDCPIIKNIGYKIDVVLQPLTIIFVTKLAMIHIKKYYILINIEPHNPKKTRYIFKVTNRT